MVSIESVRRGSISRVAADSVKLTFSLKTQGFLHLTPRSRRPSAGGMVFAENSGVIGLSRFNSR
jgi:hypothetical protein